MSRSQQQQQQPRARGGVQNTAYRIPEPLPPVEEEYNPRIEDCLTDQEVLIMPFNSDVPVLKKVDIVKSHDALQAYVVIRSKPEKDLSHHGPGWGHVCFGLVLPRIADGIYQQPSPETAEYVAIKRLNKAVVNHSLSQGKNENPYKELYRMQTIGDNIHVLGCVEALQDQEHLYIIMPYCEHESLVEWIPWRQGMAQDQAKVVFAQILENILYLQSHGICHRDLSPDNCMIYKGRVVFTDLAMSFRIPSSGFVTPLGGFGKPAYLAPEVCFNLPFEANACDLWSSVVILFNLLTGELLYEFPHPSDMMFRYFVLARGISRIPVNERTVEVMTELNEEDQSSVWKVASKCMALPPEALDLMDGVLCVNPSSRWKTLRVQECPWVNQP